MNKLTIMNKVAQVTKKSGLKFRKHSPEILVVSGVVGVVASAVWACKATTKLDAVLEEPKAQIEKIHVLIEHPDMIPEGKEYTEEDSKKDLAIVYTQSALKVVKLYAGPVILGTVSIAAILGGHNILRGRNVALAAAYATLDSSFKDYRNEVVDRFGKEVDYQLKHKLHAEEITEKVEDPETGKIKKVKKTVLVKKDDAREDGYSRLFDAACPNWVNDPNLNRSFLSAAQSYYNDKLHGIGYVFLSDIYNYLGFRITPESRVVGWTLNGDGDGYIDFGFDQDDMFMSGYNKDVWLDFNVDGPILDTFVQSDKTFAIC